MARRSKNEDLVTGIAQLVGLCVALSFVYPPFRQKLLDLGVVFVVLVILAAVALIGFGLYRLSTRPGLRQALTVPVVIPPGERAAAAPATAQAKAPDSTAELIQQLRSIDWFQFEKLIGTVCRKLGYSVTRRGGANPDGGIDLIIEKEGERTAVQCKHWKTWNVGVKAIREFLGALTDAGIKKGICVTLCGFTGEAKSLADKHGIEIVDETGLAKILEATDARYDPHLLAILRDRRKVCPRCESEMVLRTSGKGRGAGHQFWGCSAYPRCRYTMPVA